MIDKLTGNDTAIFRIIMLELPKLAAFNILEY